jgi:hypothetical protein
MNLMRIGSRSDYCLAREEANSEPAIFFVVITLPLSGIRDGGSEVFHEPKIFVCTPLGNADLACQLGGGAGTLDPDQVIDPGKALKDLFLHAIRFT